MKTLFIFTFSLITALQAIAQQDQPNLPWVDLSGQKERQTIIAEGKEDLYNGHPTTVMLNDNKTILCTWS